jgi:hypothetical protein
MEPQDSLVHSQALSTCPYPETDQSNQTPHPVSPRSILISLTHLCLGLSSGLFPSGFPTNYLYAFLFSPFLLHAQPSYPPALDDSNYTWQKHKSRSSSLCSFLHSPVTSSLFGPNILLSTLFSNTLSLHSSLNFKDQVLHPCRTIGEIIVLCILIFRFFDSW